LNPRASDMNIAKSAVLNTAISTRAVTTAPRSNRPQRPFPTAISTSRITGSSSGKIVSAPR
jgi:hypothetical protein